MPVDTELSKIIEGLTPKERQLLERRFGIPLSLRREDLPLALSMITREKIKAVEDEANEKLKRKGAPDDAE